ncbi:MAG: hypothetical protein HUJ68_12535 [Clostridia bacterium]|nr:hypothetical protein [Clostridia bacterium]
MKYRIKETIKVNDHEFVPQYKRFLFWHSFHYYWEQSNRDKPYRKSRLVYAIYASFNSFEKAISFIEDDKKVRKTLKNWPKKQTKFYYEKDFKEN